MASNPAPQQPAAQPTELDAAREALIKHFVDSIHGPEPAAPQIPSPQPVGGIGALLGARRPDMIPFINQQANAPAERQYAQQQAAFQAAMEGRKEAQTGIVALSSQQQKNENPLGWASLMERMNYHNAMLNKPPNAAEKAPKTAYDAKGNLIEYDTGTGRWRPAQDVGGNPIQKQPTDAEATARTAFVTTKKNLELLKSMALGQSSGGLMDRAAATGRRAFSHIPGNEMFSGQANVNDYNALVNDLGTQLRAIYGAQGIRAFQEIQLLLKNVPPYGSSPELIEQRFSKISDIVGILEQERQRMQPSAFPPDTQQPSGDPLLEKLWSEHAGSR